MSSTEVIGWFADIGLQDRPHVGGKGGSLGELQRAGIAVPPGFVVRTEAFERYLQVLERESPVREVVAALNPDDLQAVTACSKSIRARIESASFPQSVAEEIATARASLSQ